MSTHVRRLHQFALLCLLLSLLFIPAAPRVASQEQPQTTPARPQTASGDGVVLDSNPIPEGMLQSTAQASAPDTTPEAVAPAAPNASPESKPEPQAVPTPPVNATQGVIRLDVVLPPTLRPNDDLTYTYIYTNTTSTSYSNVVIQATWIQFSSNINGDWQFCPNADPSIDCKVATKTNATVSKLESCPASLTGPSTMCYNIGSLAGNEIGRFTVRLRTNPMVYPVSNGPPLRPAGSARLYTDPAGAPMSEDTASTLFVNPVLSIVKTTDASKVIYPTKEDNPPASEVVEFTLTVGNAVGANDRDTTGAFRADARPATNIKVYDTIPPGAKYISSTPAAAVDTSKNLLTWTLPGTLAVGATAPVIKVKFRKDDVGIECGRLNNKDFYASSDEYPVRLDNPSYRYGSYGQEVGVNVAPVLYIPNASPVPANITYGDQSEITVYLRNYWKSTITGKLRYELQDNVKYIASSAQPAPSQPPDTSTFGPSVIWDFSIPGTADRTKPTELTFKLRVIAGFFPSGKSGVSTVIISDPAVPTACIEARSMNVGVFPRLTVRKYTDSPNPIIGDNYIVKQGESFPYLIEIRNDSNSDATGVQVVDTFPGNEGARFTYVPNSGSPPPSQINSTLPGSLVWNNLTVPAKSKLTISYRLTVTGLNYYRYCNLVAAKLNQEAIQYASNAVCVKINPQIRLVKKVLSPTPPADGSLPIVQPGGEVTYQIELTNNETQKYSFGLTDWFSQVEYVSVVSSYTTQPPVFSDNNKVVRWQVVELAPGASIKVVVKARVPSACVTNEYENVGLFYNSDGEYEPADRSLSRPRVRVNCGAVIYSKYANRGEASLQDRVYYGLSLRNENGQAATNVVVKDVLPQGFTYEAMDSTSGLLTPPTSKTRTDGRIELTWTVSKIEAKTGLDIKYVARAAQVVGTFFNWVAVPGGNCTGNCITDTDGTLYSRHELQVKPLITMEPKINTSACAVPGDTRTYTLSILNTNNIDYTNTGVVVELPLGLTFSRVLSGTTQPSVLIDNNGVSSVVWSNIRIPARPNNAPVTQYTLQMELKVGNVWGNLNTKVQTSSPDGAIPRKENVQDPTVPVCPGSPSIAKAAGRPTVDVGGKLMYQISLANPTGSAINNISIKDVLPKDMEYDSMETGTAPQISTDKKTLTWTVNLPAGTATNPGVVILRYRAKALPTAAINSKQTNTVTATSSPALQTTVKGVNVTSATVTVVKTRSYYLPMIRRS